MTALVPVQSNGAPASGFLRLLASFSEYRSLSRSLPAARAAMRLAREKRAVTVSSQVGAAVTVRPG